METEYDKHIESVTKSVKQALTETGYDTLVIHSGTPTLYYADDQEIPFRSLPYFRWFAPLNSPHHVVIISTKDAKPLVIECMPDDYWIEHDTAVSAWRESFTHISVKTPIAVWAMMKEHANGRRSFIGDTTSSQEAKKNSIAEDAINPEALIRALNDERSIKTQYEIDCLTQANEIAAKGHLTARDAFLSGASEFEIHLAYLAATLSSEGGLPYPTITALNEKSSTLHYQHKRVDVKNGNTFLLDAGVNHRGYASDVTRTYASDSANPMFKSLLMDVINLQKKLTELVKPAVQYIELHHKAHLGIAEILKRHGIATTDGEKSIERGITGAFFPHGLGHMLGLQVHDVGGVDPFAETHPLRAFYPKVRTNRTLVEGNVTTIEPGLYFIPMLLKPLHESDSRNMLNWQLIDELTPMGGIRIEDNLVVTESGMKNLTREFLL